MASWRDTTSAQAQDDLDGLLSAAIPVAEETLAEHGEMLPFGGGVSADGEIEFLGADPETDEAPEPQEVLDALHEAARATWATGRAVAFVTDVLVDDLDALRIELEHREGVTFEIFVPYTRDAGSGALTFGEMTVGDGEPRVWGIGS